MIATSNYGLKKPAPTDNYNIQDHNDNMDIIDATLKTNSDAIATHLDDALPHKFTDGTTVYRWGLSSINGVVMFNYEEVV